MADTAVLTRPDDKPQQAVNADVWSALCAAQATFPPIGKSATGARESEKYAPLDEVLAKLRPALAANGLATSASTFVQDGFLFLRRILRHGASETEIVGDAYPVAPITQPARNIGSAMTYARRYTLLAICDVHPGNEDDDGQEASKPVRAARSAHSLRKEDVWPPIIKALKLVETSAEFKAWQDAHAETVAQFPDAWREQLDEEIEKHREHLAEQRRLARQAAEALS